jgi:hypothetical protein
VAARSESAMARLIGVMLLSAMLAAYSQTWQGKMEPA